MRLVSKQVVVMEWPFFTSQACLPVSDLLWEWEPQGPISLALRLWVSASLILSVTVTHTTGWLFSSEDLLS